MPLKCDENRLISRTKGRKTVSSFGLYLSYDVLLEIADDILQQTKAGELTFTHMECIIKSVEYCSYLINLCKATKTGA